MLNMDKLPTLFDRTLRKILSFKERDVLKPGYIDGKLLWGHASKHRTRSGVKYNRLIRLHFRFHTSLRHIKDIL
jgi:hypothetical protein